MAKANPNQFWKSVKKKLNSKEIQSDKLTVSIKVYMVILIRRRNIWHRMVCDMEITETELKTATFSQKNTPIVYEIWATSWEKLFMPYANNKGADQPSHLHSLISAFVFAAQIV